VNSAERAKMKEDIAVVAAFYGLSKESEAMAYKAAQHSVRARAIYRRLRRSIEREKK
jgi:hypothetical protein